MALSFHACRIDELERGITEIIEQASVEEHGDSAAKS